MIRRKPLKALFYLCLLIVLLLIGYKIYLDFFEPDYEAVHTEQIDRIHQALDDSDQYSFAVVGNINNSVGVFERKIIPMLNGADVNFVISAGNAVSSGGEDKYRALYRTMSQLQVPYLLTFGDNEFSNFGSFRFYEHYGPYFYSFRTGDSLFVFLDATGKTPYRWQLRWLSDLMRQDESQHRFVFIGEPLRHVDQDTLFDDEDEYLQNPRFRDGLIDLFQQYNVDAVFSANLPFYAEQQAHGTRYIVTGGAGGLVLNNDTSFYHFVRVDVDKDGVSTTLERLNIGQHPVFKQLESFWFFIHSLFYVGYVNFILILGILGLVAIKLYSLIFVDRDYYPDFDLDPTPWREKQLRVAMFTNNYLPFIGGVPLSIERLRQGLEALAHQVRIVAPRYRDQANHEPHVVRVPSLVSLGAQREFRIANIFLPRIRQAIRTFKPDIIHVHHPFWLGSLGLWMARRLKVPAVYTYHTRLEHYAHFVPLPGLIFRNLISHALIKHFANKCDGVIVPTYSAEEYLRMIGVKSLAFVQPTGIEFDRFQSVSDADVAALREKLGIRDDEHVFVSVSRLSTEKNIDFMIEAIAGLREQTDRPFRFLMIGDGHERERLQGKIDDLGLTDVFMLIGAVPPDDMATYYKAGDTFLFASVSETQGMVILEAMAAGLPVVAVRSSGIDDVVREGHNGFKTPKNLERWRQAVQRIMDDEALHRELADNALAFARDFSIDHFARDVENIYATVLADYHKRREE
ncbi:glycosyltransferase [Marinobacter sp. JSM 1782161]|uniref:glycosyltransferase n=1 Tax=Marinobacter sp. JSM 1782161 TaxID=2685906 RepID=UPI001403D5F3|nr:glycosyltransferase [Marinobacter sp. JSM 1782161]